MLGLALRFQESVSITEATCMKQGGGVCDFKVRLVPPKAEGP